MICHLKHKLFLSTACRWTFWSGAVIHGKTRLRMVGIMEVCCMADIPPSHRHCHFAPQPRYFALQVRNQVTEVVTHAWVAVPGSQLSEIDRSLSIVIMQQDIPPKAEQSSHALRGRTFDRWKRRHVILQFEHILHVHVRCLKVGYLHAEHGSPLLEHSGLPRT